MRLRTLTAVLVSVVWVVIFLVLSAAPMIRLYRSIAFSAPSGRPRRPLLDTQGEAPDPPSGGHDPQQRPRTGNVRSSSQWRLPVGGPRFRGARGLCFLGADFDGRDRLKIDAMAGAAETTPALKATDDPPRVEGDAERRVVVDLDFVEPEYD